MGAILGNRGAPEQLFTRITLLADKYLDGSKKLSNLLRSPPVSHGIPRSSAPVIAESLYLRLHRTTSDRKIRLREIFSPGMQKGQIQDSCGTDKAIYFFPTTL